MMIVRLGNTTYYGPFESYDEARSWAEMAESEGLDDGNWELLSLESPESLQIERRGR